MGPEFVLESGPKPGVGPRFLLLRDSVLLRRSFLLLLALVPLLTPWVSPADDTPFIYPYCFALNLLSAVFCMAGANRHPGERLRWHTIACSQVLHSMAYLAPAATAHGWVSEKTGAWVANGCVAVALTLFIPVLMSIRTEATVLTRTLDVLLASLTCVLLMLAMGSGALPGDGTVRVVVNLLALSLLAAAAFSAKISSKRVGLRLFTSAVSGYLFTALIVSFLANVVNIHWLAHPQVLASDVLLVLPPLGLCEWALRRKAPLALLKVRLDRAVLDNLQPSTFALGSIALALYALRAHQVEAGSLVMLVTLCFALRTHLAYRHMLKDKLSLQARAVYLESLASQDPLTGIRNRRWFERTAAARLASWQGRPAALLLLDADKFKQINDTFGHLLGDQVLRVIAELLDGLTHATGEGCCARMGGDEFIALLPVDDAAAATALAEGLRAQVQAYEFAAPFRAAVTIGVALTTRGLALPKLMQWADAALYRAKARGRNAVQLVNTDAPSLEDEEQLEQSAVA